MTRNPEIGGQRPAGSGAPPGSPWEGIETLSDLASRLGDGPSGQPILRSLASRASPGGSVSRNALKIRIRDLAARLASPGPERARVILAIRDPLEFLVAFLACMRAGAVAVPVHPPADRGAPERLEPLLRKLSQVAPRFFLTDADWCSEVRHSLPASVADVAEFLSLDEIEAGSGAAWAPPSISPAAPALIQFSSGSTREPRGILLSHRNLVANLRQIIGKHVAGNGPGCDGVSWLPPFHDMGLIVGMLAPLFGGGSLTLMRTDSFLRAPLRWVREISHRGAHISATPPFGLDLCRKALARASEEDLQDLDLRTLRLCIVGAEPVEAATLQRFFEAFEAYGLRPEALHPGYGLGEATVYAASDRVDTAFVGEAPPGVLRFQRQDLGVGRAILAGPETDPESTIALPSYGEPLVGLERAIVAPESGEVLQEGEVGEIWLRSPAVASGYLDATDDTSLVFGAELKGAGPGWLRTGDSGFEFGGKLFVAGRLKDVVLVNGRTIHPGDAEAVAREADARVRGNGVVAFGIEGAGTERLVVLVATVPGVGEAAAAATLEAVGRGLRTELGVGVICGLIAPGAILRTSSGKLRRAAIRARFLAGEVAVQFPGVPEGERGGESGPDFFDEGDPDPLAEELGEIWKRCLAVDWVRRGDDFFLLGGDSIRGIELLAGIQKRLGVELSPGAFETTSQFGELLELVRSHRDQAPSEGPKITRATGLEVPLLSGEAGHFDQITDDPAEFLERGRREVGGVFAMDFGREAAVVCGTRESVRRVLVTNAAGYCRDVPSTNVSRVAAGAGMFTLENSDPESRPGRRAWIARGKAAVPLLRGQVLPLQAAALVEELAEPDAGPVAILPAVRRALLRVILQAFAGIEVGAEEADELQQALAIRLRDAVQRTWGRFSAPLWIPAPWNRKVTAAAARLKSLYKAVRPEFREQAIPLSVTGGSSFDAELCDFLTFLQAGVAPTSAGIAWTLHLLAREESGRKFLAAAQEAGGEPWRAAVAATLQEGMRLRPPVAYIERRALADDRIAGYRIPAGTLVVVSFLSLHRDSAVWRDPAAFSPGRFAEGEAGRIPRGAYAPFGLGPHRCVGEPLGKFVATELLATLLERIGLEPADQPMPVGQTLGLAYEPALEAALRFRRR